jgi:hypothetical protein
MVPLDALALSEAAEAGVADRVAALNARFGQVDARDAIALTSGTFPDGTHWCRASAQIPRCSCTSLPIDPSIGDLP